MPDQFLRAAAILQILEVSLDRMIDRQEDRFRYVVFECDSALSVWTHLCLRQADLVLLVGLAEGAPSCSEVAQSLFKADCVTQSANKELVLLHTPLTKHPSGTARWLAAYPVSRHHHIRLDRSEDYARFAKDAQSGYQDIQFSCPRIESCPRNVQ